MQGRTLSDSQFKHAVHEYRNSVFFCYPSDFQPSTQTAVFRNFDTENARCLFVGNDSCVIYGLQTFIYRNWYWRSFQKPVQSSKIRGLNRLFDEHQRQISYPFNKFHGFIQSPTLVCIHHDFSMWRKDLNDFFESYEIFFYRPTAHLKHKSLESLIYLGLNYFQILFFGSTGGWPEGVNSIMTLVTEQSPEGLIA